MKACLLGDGSALGVRFRHRVSGPRRLRARWRPGQDADRSGAEDHDCSLKFKRGLAYGVDGDCLLSPRMLPVLGCRENKTPGKSKA